MSFSRVTEEQTLEISRDGSVRFEKSNILDTEETRELLSPDATANIFTAFKDFFTIRFEANRLWQTPSGIRFAEVSSGPLLIFL